jgi:hypothetical protein
VAAYCGFNIGFKSTAAHHVPDIGARHRARAEFLRLTNRANRGAEQRPLAEVSRSRPSCVHAFLFGDPASNRFAALFGRRMMNLSD